MPESTGKLLPAKPETSSSKPTDTSATSLRGEISSYPDVHRTLEQFSKGDFYAEEQSPSGSTGEIQVPAVTQGQESAGGVGVQEPRAAEPEQTAKISEPSVNGESAVLPDATSEQAVQTLPQVDYNGQRISLVGAKTVDELMEKSGSCAHCGAPRGDIFQASCTHCSSMFETYALKAPEKSDNLPATAGVASQKTESAETISRREDVRTQLGEMGKILLDLGDERVIMVSAARAAGDTPLADQYRASVLRQLSHTVVLPQEHPGRQALDRIKLQAAELTAGSESNFSSTAFADFLRSHGMGHVVPMIEEGRMDAFGVFSQVMAEQEKRGNASLSKSLWAAMGGETKSLPRTAGEIVLAATGVKPDIGQTATVGKMLAEKKYTELKFSSKDFVAKELQMLVVSSMIISMLSSLLGSDSGGNKH